MGRDHPNGAPLLSERHGPPSDSRWLLGLILKMYRELRTCPEGNQNYIKSLLFQYIFCLIGSVKMKDKYLYSTNFHVII